MTGLFDEHESAIEKDCVEWAIDQGYFEFKVMRASKRALPDRFFARAGFKMGGKVIRKRRVVFVEFKRLKGKARENQVKRLAELWEAGIEAWVCDSREEFYARMA